MIQKRNTLKLRMYNIRVNFCVIIIVIVLWFQNVIALLFTFTYEVV